MSPLLSLYLLSLSLPISPLSVHYFLPCSVRQSQSTNVQASTRGYSSVDSEPVIIRHPDIPKAESLIRNAWQDAKLVAD